MAEPSPAAARAGDLLHRAALGCTLLMPLGVLHAFALAEVCIVLTGLCFLARRALARDWGWLRAGWMPVGLAWWGWMILCSIPFPGREHAAWPALVQALVVGRYLIFVAALEHDVLRSAQARRWLWGILATAAAYIAAQSLLQVVTGRNLAGYPRWGDGEITGPFLKPRAGAPYSRLLPTALLPPLAALLNRPGLWPRLAAPLLAIAALGTSILIGQRMPLLLTLLALALAGLLLRRLRPVVIGAVLAGAVLLAASAVIVPPTFYRLVTKFTTQMADFPESPYGQLASRALAIGAAHPVMGLGFDGFRRACNDEAYIHHWSWPRSINPEGCNLHPHNHYLQALTDSGLPGLALFSALVLAWLRPLARGLWSRPDPLRVGLFLSALIQQWPLASTENAFSLDLGGLFFVLLGLGLAVARATGSPTRSGASS
jgi:O-antigen ligase